MISIFKSVRIQAFAQVCARIIALLCALSCFAVVTMPWSFSGHPLHIAYVCYLIVMFPFSIALLYGLLNEKAFATPMFLVLIGFFIGMASRLILILPILLSVFIVVAIVIIFIVHYIRGTSNYEYVSMLSAMLFGFLFISCEFTPHATTKPLLKTLTPITADLVVPKDTDVAPLARDAWVNLQSQQYHVSILPILRLRDYNMHGFWSVVNPPTQLQYQTLHCEMLSRNEASDIFIGHFQSAIAKHQVMYQRQDVHKHVVSGETALDQCLYSHLNHGLLIQIIGHNALSLGFSSLRDERMRLSVNQQYVFASVNADRALGIYHCAHDEKGPFTCQAKAVLQDQQEFMTLYDNGKAFMKIDISDWIAQLSTELSPTAGYGICQNAIECMVLGQSDAGPVNLWFSYAATSIGRGFQCLGHQPGVYRMRLSCEFLPQ